MAKIINDQTELQNLFDDINNNIEIECKFLSDVKLCFNAYGYQNVIAGNCIFVKYPSINVELDISNFNDKKGADFFEKHRFVKINNKRVYLKNKTFFMNIDFADKLSCSNFPDLYIFKVTNIHL